MTTTSASAPAPTWARVNPYTPATTAFPPLTVTGRLDRLRAAFDDPGSTRWW